MTPYTSFVYFAFLLYPLALALPLGLIGRLGRRSILVISLAVLLVQFTNPLGNLTARAAGLRQALFLAAYAGGSVALVMGYDRVVRRHRTTLLLSGAIALALAPLIAVKLYPLAAAHGWFGIGVDSATAVGTVGLLPPSDLFDAFGFLGISYMTFRVIDAIIVIHDGLVTQAPTPAGVASYLLFFPTISAGPIDRYRRYTENVKGLPHDSRQYLADIEAGIHRIAQGFLYKFIVAYLIYQHILLPAREMPGLGGMIRFMYAYSFYLFFDFAGYSAFAIGVGRLFGVQVPENFAAPFLSRDFREMWSRWNMSLSFWLRDHVYMRFMLAATRGRWFGSRRHLTSNIGFLLTFGLMGLWHGLFPHYIVYGFYQGAMMVAYDMVGRWNRRRKLVPLGVATDLIGLVLTFNLFCFGLLIFSGHLFT